MTRKLINSGSIFEEKMSFSRAVVVGNMVFVSGSTGYDYATMTISSDLVEQTEQTFKNIAQALQQAESSFEDVVRITYFIVDPKDFERCYGVLNNYLGKSRPACTVICTGLVNDQLKIEIEVTAIKKTNS